MPPAPAPRVLFLCTGNYYRSRFAELWFNHSAQKVGLPWRATSRGLALERGTANVGPMATAVSPALLALGAARTPEHERMPLPAQLADFESAQRVVALLEAEHRPLMLERFPDWADRLEYWQVDDVPGILPEIEREVNDLIARLFTGGHRQVEAPFAAAAPKVEKKPKPKVVRVGRETQGRRGKGVTTVFDLAMSEDEVQALATLLKQKVGTGGTAKDGKIEIQGDQRDRVTEELIKLGYQVKRSGG